MPRAIGIDGPDFGARPDLAAVGSAASARKDKGGGQTLQSFSVKRGDNGGVLVCETYEKKPPAGRRQGAAYPGGGDYKENPFSPDDGAAAAEHITGLLTQMGVSAPAPMATPEPPALDVTAARGPRGSALSVAPAGPPPGGPPPAFGGGGY